MILPLVQGAQAPGMGICPGCGGEKSSRRGEFIVLSAGAMLPVAEGVAVPAFDGLAFLELLSHGSRGRSVRIARDVQGGQFSIHFCSTACLRSFLNECVDLLES